MSILSFAAAVHPDGPGAMDGNGGGMSVRRALDDPRVLQSQPFRAVHFIFGLAGMQPVAAGSLVVRSWPWA